MTRQCVCIHASVTGLSVSVTVCMTKCALEYIYVWLAASKWAWVLQGLGRECVSACLSLCLLVCLSV